ncbi:PI-PLC X domain-containing protein [Escovopsis weberi]|uniref:PI-PLC X domain-containing protein n=1 Tax=Escovopsis weberi TaxID=150374 RepID=A0A0N0RSV7_ESCWE|nr:PI-PLC X domain-containing protein [Escovopsis weberi]
MAILWHALVAGLAALAGRAMASPTSSAPAPFASPSSSTSPSTSPLKACNNSPTLCERAYNWVTFMGAHDSAFLRDASTGHSLAGNQYQNATASLDGGIRLLQAQVHKQEGQLRLCHTLCNLLDAGSLQDWLAAIHAWMEQNPREVVTLLLVNSDSASAADFDAVFRSSGISKLGYMPPALGAGDWTTLGDMVDRGTRLVSFVTNIEPLSTAPYLVPEFDRVFETPFTVTDIAGFNCTVDRPARLAGGGGTAAVHKGMLGLVNHFKDITISESIAVPDTDTLGVVNSDDAAETGALGTHLAQCAREWGGRRPSFALVDFWDVGRTVQVADAMNGISDASGRKAPAGGSAADGSKVSMGAGINGDVGRNVKGAMVVFLAMVLML